MPLPSIFITEMNKLCIQMTHARNKKESKKERKMILRIMKKLVRKVCNHGKKYMDMLSEYWKETELSENQAKRIIERIDNILKKLPDTMKQAHERIIGEISNGLIIDRRLYKDSACADVKLLPESLDRLEGNYNGYKPENVATDRGCDSAKNRKDLEIRGITNFICPKSPRELEIQLENKSFRNHQKRRGQTEARIGIFKNNFLGNPLKNKDFGYKEESVAWSILAHNLWLLARLPVSEGIKLKKVS
jgi:hypothetical protein